MLLSIMSLELLGLNFVLYTHVLPQRFAFNGYLICGIHSWQLILLPLCDVSDQTLPGH